MKWKNFVQSKKSLKGFEHDLDSSLPCLHHIVVVPKIWSNAVWISFQGVGAQQRCSPALLGFSFGSYLLFSLRKDALTKSCVGCFFLGDIYNNIWCRFAKCVAGLNDIQLVVELKHITVMHLMACSRLDIIIQQGGIAKWSEAVWKIASAKSHFDIDWREAERMTTDAKYRAKAKARGIFRIHM